MSQPQELEELQAAANAHRSEWLVLCPAYQGVHPLVERTLDALQSAGVAVHRATGSSDIARLRCILATEFLRSGKRRALWLDADEVVSIEDAARLLLSPHPFVTAIAAARRDDKLLVELDEPGPVTLGALPAFPVRRAGFGCMMTDRSVFERIQTAGLARLTTQGFWGFFVPFVTASGEYLAEDYACCQRARWAGVQLWADPSIRVGHISEYVRYPAHLLQSLEPADVVTVSERLEKLPSTTAAR